LTDSITLHMSVFIVRAQPYMIVAGDPRNMRMTHHSAVMNLTALPPVLDISFCILVAARPPPAPPLPLTVPRITCVTERRPKAME